MEKEIVTVHKNDDCTVGDAVMRWDEMSESGPSEAVGMMDRYARRKRRKEERKRFCAAAGLK